MSITQPRIFIIEDNPVYQTLILKQLEDISTDFQVYNTGENFLKDTSIYAADLIILDYNLDGKLNGYDILRELKKMPEAPPVIFFSSNLEISITSSILKLGVVEYIEKNIFSLSRLKDTIQNVLENSFGKPVVQ